MGQDNESRLGVSWAQVAGSALAAVSTAVLLSTLGVAGTVIGAAVGSIAATVSTALYTRTLDVSRQQVAAQAAALRRVSRARSELDDAVEELAGTDPAATPARTAVAVLERDEEPDPSDVRRDGGLPPALATALERLSWRRLVVVAAAVFVGVMGVITAFELTTGQAVSTYTGGSDRQTGSTVPGLGTGDASTPTPAERATPDGSTEDPDGLPSVPSTDEPTTEPTTEPDDRADDRADHGAGRRHDGRRHADPHPDAQSLAGPHRGALPAAALHNHRLSGWVSSEPAPRVESRWTPWPATTTSGSPATSVS